MKFKRTLSAIVCACIALGTVLPLILSAFPRSLAKEIYTTRIEAEYARWSGYQTVKSSGTAPNPTVLGDAASTHTYATWSELSALNLNKNIHIYVAFCVDVPVAGTYQISTANVIRMSAGSTPYAAILVNPQHNGQAYKLNYKAVDTAATYCVSEQVSVHLQKGRNMIYMTPFTSDQSINWSDADYIEIVGEYPVSHVVPSGSVAVAADDGGHYKFSSASSKTLSGADVSAAKGIVGTSLTRAQLSALPHVSYTVEAPADGYYDISLNYQYKGSSVSGYSVSLLVDNRPAETKPIYATSDTVADISTYLTKGVHILTVPVVLPSTDSGKTIAGSEIKGLTLYDGLVLSDQFNGFLTGSVLEAESTAFTWRYTSVYEDNGRKMIGGSQPGLAKQTYDQITSGAKLDKNQPMLTYQIDVLEAGDYTLNVSYRNYSSSDYYMIVSVDDTTYAKAVYTGKDPNHANRLIASTTLTLTEGRHFIRLITLPGDSQASWIDVDCAAFKGPSPVIGIPDWTHLQSVNASAYQGFSGTVSYSSYGEWWDSALTGYRGNSMAEAAGITTKNFTPADLSNLAWVSYDVHVPRDGFYDMQTYLQPDPSSSGSGKILLGIKNTNVNLINQAQGIIGLHYSGNSAGWLDLEGEYKAIGVTAKNYGQRANYAMLLRVKMDNGKFYAFRIYNDASLGYSYSRYGDGGSSSGWGGQRPVGADTTALLNGNGAKFQVERTSGNTLVISLNGQVIDTYTMEGVSSNNKVVSIGFKQCGNPASSESPVEVPFEVTPVQATVSIDMPGIENGSVTTEKDSYKVGDTVVLNVNPLDGYCQKLTMNGEPILLDWTTGQYSFKATSENYTIDGRFEKILWNDTTYRWVDVQLDEGAKRWWIADLSSYLSEGDYTIIVSGLLDYSGGSKDRCDIGALTVSGGITSPCNPEAEGKTVINAVTKVDTPNQLLFRNDPFCNIADPFVLDNTAIDGYYYLYGTWGAFRCYRSRNMMDWQLCGEVLEQYREGNKIWDSATGKYSYQVLGNDLWAPEVIYDPDTKLYYMFFSASPDLKGQAVKGNATELLMVATSTSPTGPFNLVNFKSASSCGGAENVHSYSTSNYSDYFAPYLFLDPAKNNEFSLKINNNESRASLNGGYVAGIDPHPYVAPDGTKYFIWVDSYGPDRICAVEMENWLKPKWETATVLIYNKYYSVADWQNGSTNKVTFENDNANEGPFIIEHNGKYYLTYSANSWKKNDYLVAQAVADNVLGPYTKLKESEGGIVLSGVKQGGQNSVGTGHHSMLQVGDQLFMIYHRHSTPGNIDGGRNPAIDEVKWATINGREVMYLNGPNTTLQPKVEKHSNYRNIAEEATVTGNNSSANLTYLNDGLLSNQKNAHANVTSAVGETTISKTTTFTFRFEEARPVKSVMIYNSRLNAQIFRQVKQIKLICLEDGKTVEKYIYNVPFDSAYYSIDSSGKVTYVEPCAAAYAIFDELNVFAVEITMEIPSGQSSVGISEIMILGK